MHLQTPWLSWFDDARRDLVHAARLLRRDPVLTITATLSLAIGIGANTTIFTVVNALLFQPPSGVAESSRLVDIGSTRGGVGFGPSSYPSYVDIRQRASTLDAVYAYSRFPEAMSFGGAGFSTSSVFGSVVTANYFTALGAVPALGRLFNRADSDQPGASPVTVLSDGLWARLNRDPGIVGRTVRLNGQPFTVVGVASKGFHGTGVREVDVWVPAGMVASLNSRRALTDRTTRGFLIGGRLKPGVSIDQAAAEIDVIGRTLEPETQDQNRSGLRLLALSPTPGNRGPLVAFVVFLMAIVSFVLIIACTNVSGILLARAAARPQEMALRLAIGAGRSRLVRQLLTETLLLFVAGGIAGLLLARGMTSVLVSRLPMLPFPVALWLPLDARIVAFTVGLSLVAALLSGLAPALQAARTALLAGLKNETVLSGRFRLRHAFVLVQVALSVVLLIGAGLFVRALHRSAAIDSGFDSHGVELASLDLAQAGYSSMTGPPFVRDLLERVRQLPGVEMATIASVPPGGFEVRRESLSVPGSPPAGDRAFVSVDWNIVEPAYFSTLRTPIVAGRDFTSADRKGTQPVAIVSEAAARRFWPAQPATGQYLLQPTWGPLGPTHPMRSLLVVGVARDISSTSLIDGFAGAAVYVPFQQHYLPGVTIVTRTRDGQRIADRLRALVASMSPDLPVVSARTLDESVALGLTPQRVAAAVASSLGIVALILTAIGIYGVIAHAVTRRTREIGIRIALGARTIDVIRMVLREAVALTSIGSAIGIAAAAAVSQVLAGFLFGIPSVDPITFAATAALFVAIALSASYAPVRRATRIDPARAFRCE
jgi:putative ABC transport system permease protein